MKHHKLTEGKFHTNIKSQPTSSRPTQPPSGQNSKEKFEEEFEDIVYIDPTDGGYLEFIEHQENIIELYSKYLNIPEDYEGKISQKVKISAKKGKIIIEGIK